MMKPKYKVGDKVRVASHLVSDTLYPRYEFPAAGNRFVGFNTVMEKYKGKIVTIKYLENYGYRITEDSQNWVWCDAFFEDAFDIDIDALNEILLGE